MEGFIIFFGIVALITGICYMIARFGGFSIRPRPNYFWISIVLMVIGLVLIIPFIKISYQNAWQGKRQQINNAWAQVNIYQARKDSMTAVLIPLMNQYVQHERDLINVVQERSLDNLRLLFEKYPDLKASHTIQDMMNRLVGFNDDLVKTKNYHNGLVTEYNTWVRTWPQKDLRPANLPDSLLRIE